MEEITPEIVNSTGVNPQERNWAMISHLGGLIPGYFVCWIIPLLVWLIKGKDSDFIYKQSREALNFQVSVLIYEGFALLLMFTIIGIPITVLVFIFFWIVNIFCSLKGAILVARGKEYRYPFNLKLIN